MSELASAQRSTELKIVNRPISSVEELYLRLHCKRLVNHVFGFGFELVEIVLKVYVIHLRLFLDDFDRVLLLD